MKSMHVVVLALTACLMAAGCDSGTDGSGDGADTPLTSTFTIKKSGLTATFDASGVTSEYCDSSEIAVRWDFTNDGTPDTDWTTEKTANFTYPTEGSYVVRLETMDTLGYTDSATRTFKITETNTAPMASFNANLIQGTTASLDATISDVEDSTDDLLVRWDFDGDGNYDTDWAPVQPMQHTYDKPGTYTITLDVKDLNDAVTTVSQSFVASAITIRNSFLTIGSPYMIGMHFRMVNNITKQVVTPADVPALTRANFAVTEDDIPIDLSETNQLLINGKRPLTLVLLLDFTGSMYDAGAVGPMISAAKEFIDSQGDTTSISLWAFWDRQGGNAQIDDYVRCDQAGRAKLKADLAAFASQPRDRGATEIWDTLKTIIDDTTKFPLTDNGVNRGIVFLSDGHDTTSVNALGDVIKDAKDRAIFVFAVGMAFRSTEYPADEDNLKNIAQTTGGLYFTANQIEDLSAVFGQISENVNADWTLSYITLQGTGQHTVTVACDYLGGIATMSCEFTVGDAVKGDIKKGQLLAYPTVDSATGLTAYSLYASYIPRNISEFKIKAASGNAVSLRLCDTDTICNPADGWTISPDVAAGEAVPADGWYTISCTVPLEMGAWGRIAQCVTDTAGTPAVHFELPALTDQPALYGDKTIVFQATDDVILDVP